jgi:hypothetical protein
MESDSLFETLCSEEIQAEAQCSKEWPYILRNKAITNSGTYIRLPSLFFCVTDNVALRGILWLLY